MASAWRKKKTRQGTVFTQQSHGLASQQWKIRAGFENAMACKEDVILQWHIRSPEQLQWHIKHFSSNLHSHMAFILLAILLSTDRWAEKDVNPALFSRELMANSSTFLKDEEGNHDPQILLMKAHAATSSVGSATVIIAMLDKAGTLKIASVGDCGLKVIRKGQVMFSTCPQEHYFDCPYQISSEAVGQTYQDALVCTVYLMEGDMIVSGSDGLFDNIFDHEIISVISESPGVDEAAKALAELARKHSVDVTFDSPYSIEARSRGFDVPWWKKLLGAKLIGGKMDDITVIVAQVKTVVIPDDDDEGGADVEEKVNEQGSAVAVESVDQNED